MTNSLRLAISVLALTAILPAVQAQTAAAPAPVEAPKLVTLEMCVTKALEQNFDVSIQRFTTASATDDVEIAKAAYDPTFGANATKAFAKTAPDPLIADSSSQSDVQAASLSVSQKIITGATINASSELDRNKRIIASTTGVNPAYLGDISLRISQPLLKGAGTSINRAAIDRAKLGVERANYDLKSTVLTVIRSVESAYYNVVFAREQREVRRFSLAVAEKLLEENKARRTAGVATDLQVLQSEVGVATAQRNLVLAEQTVRDNEDALLQLIGRFEFDKQVGTVKLQVDDPVPKVSFDKSYKLALDNTPEYLSSQRLIDQLKLDLKTNKDRKLPQVDLGGGVGYTSREGSAGNASREIWTGKGYNWQVDLTVSVPWKFRAADATYRQTQLALNREQTRQQQIDQNILVFVRTAVRSVETNVETYRLSQLSTELSMKQFEQEKARYEAGLSTFNFVQQAQAAYDDSRVSELQSRVNLRISLAELSRLEGSSLQRYHVELAQAK
jgi:outer membrane protein TolC